MIRYYVFKKLILIIVTTFIISCGESECEKWANNVCNDCGSGSISCCCAEKTAEAVGDGTCDNQKTAYSYLACDYTCAACQ